MKMINSPSAPVPNGPYSHAVRAGDFLFLSGQLPVNPSTGRIESEDIEEQTRQVLENVRSVLESAGAQLTSVVRVGVYLVDKAADFAAMNEIYGEYFPHRPARTTLETPFIKEMGKRARIEIDVVAYLGE